MQTGKVQSHKNYLSISMLQVNEKVQSHKTTHNTECNLPTCVIHFRALPF